MVGRILASTCVLLVAGCTVLARPSAPAHAPRAVLAATAEPRATIAPLTLPHGQQPTLAPDVGRPRSAPEAAQRVAQAIDSLDLAELRRLMYGGGWQFARPGGDISLKLLPREAVEWLRKRTPDGKIRAQVDTSQLFPVTAEHPAGLVYAPSTWTAFDRHDSVRVDIVLMQDVDGAWYWSGILIASSR